jgi:glycolate oxidase iron-sulfur subunit
LAEEHKVLRHLPLYFLGMGKGLQLPSLSGEFLSETLPELNPSTRKVNGRSLRAAYFAGCMTEYALPNVGKSIVSVLNKLGVEGVFPRSQVCCGIAVAANGDVETARDMALRNLKILSETGADLIITGCATCGSTLKEGWINLFRDDDARRAAFEGLAGKVRDFSEVLVDLADFKPLRYRSKLPANLRVTYHDPCHLAGYQGVVSQPRRILRKAFGDNFIEMDHQGCCGCGGSFMLHSRDLSERIANEKIAAIKRTGADVVVNTCPGCMIQLINELNKHGLPQQVLHLAEVVEPMDDNGEGRR